MKKEIQCGIYKIINLKNNKIYVGSAKNINRRWKRHICELNKQTHHNIILQNAWNKYGPDSFNFEILELVNDSNELLEREEHYIDKLQPFGKVGYNIALNASGGDILTGNPKRIEIIDKISNSMKKTWSNKPLEEKEAIRTKMLGENNPSWNGGSSYKFCKCGKKIAPINNTCRECMNYAEENNPFFGKHHTNKHKLTSSKNRKGKYYGSQNKPILIDNIEYKSIGDASLALGIEKLTIRWRVLSKNEKFKNYKYKI